MLKSDDVTIDSIYRMIGEFYRENGDSERLINSLFKHADNSNIENVFCRVACIDAIYSTQIQRFHANGIYHVSEHIHKNSKWIDETVLKGEQDFELFDTLINVELYSEANGIYEKKIKLPSFMSKFLSFSMPDVYPIIDSRVKRVIGFHGSDYKRFCDMIRSEKEKYCGELGINLSLKQWDMFLWQLDKHKERESRANDYRGKTSIMSTI